MLSPRLCFPGDKQAVLGEDELADLISMDHYLTVRHFTVAEEWKPLSYIRMLGHALPSMLNAMTLRRAWPVESLSQSSLGLSERDLSILTRDFFVSSCLCYAMGTTTPFHTDQKYFPRT